ncbi:MAG TPA: hypothetical protein VNW71_22755 [Thermoanaerobaculia bacterium]|nr:hypothetical protein [Thermoanaerobaculia bacterium]
MDRKSCGETVLDICGSHGIWFDREELEHFMGWVRDRAEAHLRAVGAPVPLYPSLTPPPEGGRCGFTVGDLPLLELVAVIFEIFDA